MKYTIKIRNLTVFETKAKHLGKFPVFRTYILAMH